ncbi:hypothetical protein [Alkalicoccobacillus murimartini]|uniref:Uncharacterized protein n=1 Tax=Alkalicoccobacillus murimartini TaxID=171685 RepID=A0ABT9YGB3_9BACI|nr:hypothetical protein [Alkalicoccobacillus murimartini]MDQ0206901.1 hypothetical protein [Alkalicoccobacillus murimartini]
MRKLIFAIFIISVILFTVFGSVLVLGQLVSLLALQGSWMIALNENLAEFVYGLTAIAGLSGYLLYYFKKPPTTDSGKEDSK